MGLNIIKDFLVMSIKNKTENVDWETLGTNVSLLPLVYLIVTAPGLLVLLGMCCLIAAGVCTFYAVLDFPREFILVLGGSLIVLGAMLAISYRIIIKFKFRIKKHLNLEQVHASAVLKSPLDQALSPFLKQLAAEHRLFLNKN